MKGGINDTRGICIMVLHNSMDTHWNDSLYVSDIHYHSHYNFNN